VSQTNSSTDLELPPFTPAAYSAFMWIPSQPDHCERQSPEERKHVEQ